MEYWFFALLVPVGFIGGITYLIIYLTRAKNPNHKPLDWRRAGVAIAITTVTPYFIGFSTSAVFDKLEQTNSLIMMVAMSIIFIIVGLAIAHHTVISGSLIVGSMIAIIYAVALNIDTVPPSVITVLAGLGLALLIYFAYKRLQEKEVI